MGEKLVIELVSELMLNAELMALLPICFLRVLLLGAGGLLTAHRGYQAQQRLRV